MIEEEKIDSIGNRKQLAGCRDVLHAWIYSTRRVSMGDEKADRIMPNAEFDKDPEAHGYAGTLALREPSRMTPPPVASCV
nr:hypothetical protein [Qipengyuania aerophila]